MKKIGHSFSSAIFCMVIFFLAAACSSSTDSIPDEERNVRYQVTITDDGPIFAEYHHGGGITTGHNISFNDGEWESSVFTVEHETEMFITVSGEVPRQTEVDINISIYVNGVVKNSYSTGNLIATEEPIQLSEVTVSHVIGE